MLNILYTIIKELSILVEKYFYPVENFNFSATWTTVVSIA